MNAAEKQIAKWKELDQKRLEKASEAWQKLHTGKKLTEAEIAIAKDALKYYIMYTAII